eukprot:CAMPEP_0116022932 /NCGR_PEP_ID=MMETSP0321-20121206/11275_1 /TAXON_ID=163516 /ORGANISM="Leptocylindrus danicus var. danicus, Strain B650" /LENGTH=449 /DNA_ID=CAMNT_0003494085 /DNA_START=75 /DNA_END=1424 /DNA_ORIENTATION=-
MLSTSWLEISEESDFSLQNFPFGVISSPAAGKHQPRCSSALGDYSIDLSDLANAGVFDGIEDFLDVRSVFAQKSLNEFMSKPANTWKEVRCRLQDLFQEKNAIIRDNPRLRDKVLTPLIDCIMHLPAEIGDYTDFYSSREHATNVGIMFRGKENALQPNWLHLPVGYHGRASSVFLSGTDIVRPSGQLQKNAKDPSLGSVYGPCKLLDFELEVAFFVGGKSLPPGQAISMDEAHEHIFGYCLMNDWSARDIQKWEYVPLGPFGSKNFATTISPWIVSPLALEPFKCPTSAKEQSDPEPLEYLRDPDYSSYDILLAVDIQTKNGTRATVTKSNFANLYWTPRQQLVHHSITGCCMRPGDLLGSGTISGSTDESLGSMLELSWKGEREVKLGGDNCETRKFLQDGDTVIISGIGSKDGVGRVGFGACVGKVLEQGSKVAPGPGRGSWVKME